MLGVLKISNSRGYKAHLFTLITLITLIAVTAATLLLSSCSPGQTGGGDATGGDKKVVDCIGREISVPAKVDSVACLYAYIGQAVVLLGGGEMITAAVAGMQRDELLLRKVPGIAQMPIPFRSEAINIESLLAIKPDFTLVRRSSAASPGEVEKLNKAKLPYAVIEFTNIEEQKYTIELIADIIGKEEQAEKYLAYYDSTLEMVRNRVAAIPADERRSVYHSVNEAVRTNHPNEISYYILERAGCVNVARDFNNAAVGGKVYVNVEQIYLWDPDCIIANESAATDYFRTQEAFTNLRAVREGRVYQLPVGATRWGHPGSIETPIATLYIAKLIYPQYFEDIDIRQEISDFYHNFWELDLEDYEIDSIISGVGMRQQKGGKQNKIIDK